MLSIVPNQEAGKIGVMGRMVLACILAAGCHSTAATRTTTPQPVSPSQPVAAKTPSFQCAHEAVEAVDPLVDHYAALGHEMWDLLHEPAVLAKWPSVTLPPNMDRRQFAAFMLTPDGKVWLRNSGLFDSWYRGMIQICETRRVASATR